MCNQACIDFGRKALKEADIKGKRVLEVGSYDVNGSLRSLAESYRPGEYIGIDLKACDHAKHKQRPCVDRIMDANDILKEFGQESFDVLINTELLEHIEDWRKAIHNFKSVVRKGGLIVITTRSIKFPRHGFPDDYWRFTANDMRAIFSDCEIELLEPDPTEPGIFIKARKPATFKEATLDTCQLFDVRSVPFVSRVINDEIFKFRKRFLRLIHILRRPR